MLQGVLVCLLSSLCLCAQADNLRLVTGDDYAPFTGQALPGGGMLTQVVKAVLDERSIAHSLDWRPWNRGYLKTLQGEYDATFPYVRTPQREQEYLYSAALSVAEQHIFSRAAEPIELDDPASLQGRRFCYPLGWQPPKALQELLDQGVLTRHSPTGLKECARLLLLGRDDFFISDLRLGETALRLTGADLSLFRRSVSAISNSTLHLIVPHKHPQGPQLIEQFNLGLRALQDSGRYQQMIDSYLQARDAGLTQLAGQHIGGGGRRQGEEQHQQGTFHRRQLQPIGHRPGQQRHSQQAQQAVAEQGRNFAAQLLGLQCRADAEQAQRQTGGGQQAEQTLAAAGQADATEVDQGPGQAGENQRVLQDRQQQAARTDAALGGQRPDRQHVDRGHHQSQHQRGQAQAWLAKQAAHCGQTQVGIEAQGALGKRPETPRRPAPHPAHQQQGQPGQTQGQHDCQGQARQRGVIQRGRGQAAQQQGGKQDEVVQPLGSGPERLVGKGLAAQQITGDYQGEQGP